MLLIITTYGQFEPVSWRPFFARDRASEKSILSLWPETRLKPLNHLQAVPRYYHAPCCFRGCGITIAVHKKFILQFLDDLSTSKLFELQLQCLGNEPLYFHCHGSPVVTTCRWFGWKSLQSLFDEYFFVNKDSSAQQAKKYKILHSWKSYFLQCPTNELTSYLKSLLDITMFSSCTKAIRWKKVFFWAFCLPLSELFGAWPKFKGKLTKNDKDQSCLNPARINRGVDSVKRIQNILYWPQLISHLQKN